MADAGAPKSSTWVWVVVLVVVALLVWSQVKKAGTFAKDTARETGRGIGEGAVDKGIAAIGSFVGNLFKGDKSTTKPTTSGVYRPQDLDLDDDQDILIDHLDDF